MNTKFPILRLSIIVYLNNHVHFLSGGVQHGMPVEVAQLDALERYVQRPQNCLQQYRDVFADVVADNGFHMPSNLTEAARLYASILDEIYG